MKEERVFFKAGAITLEGLFSRGEAKWGAVVTHPHPQMGGSMANNVVNALVEAFQGRLFSTLRFNFRGVGLSEGAFDNGVGEQSDVRAALAFLSSEGVDQIVLAGYSFGAWVNSKITGRGDIYSRGVVVSPPIGFFSFSPGDIATEGDLVICGDRDQFCPVDRLRTSIEGTGARLEIVPGADHFYWGYEGNLRRLVSEYLNSVAAGDETWGE